MAKSKVKNEYSDEKTGLAEAVFRIFENARENRRSIQEKWERNRENFSRVVRKGEWRKGDAEGWRSKTVSNVTRRNVLTAVATISNLYMADDDIPFDLGLLDEDAFPDEVVLEEAKAEMLKMKDGIRSDFRGSKSDRTLKHCIFNMALYGFYVYKRSFYEDIQKVWTEYMPKDIWHPSGFSQANVRWAQQEIHSIKPVITHVPVWDVFFDMEERDPRLCAYQIHRAMETPRWLKGMKEHPLFIPEAIKQALAQAADSNNDSYSDEDDLSTLAPLLRNVAHRTRTLRYIEFHGWLPRATVEEFEESTYKDSNREAPRLPRMGIETGAEDEDNGGTGDEIHVSCGVVNGHVVMYCRSEPEDRPLAWGYYEPLTDEECMNGIADNLENDQIAMTGSLRGMEDGIKLGSNLVVGVKESYLEEPLTDIAPGSVIKVAEDCADVRQAISQLGLNPNVAGMIECYKLFTSLSEEDSMLPRIAAGLNNSGKTTAFEIGKQIEQMDKYLGMICSNLDEQWTEPNVEWLYANRMMDPAAQGKGAYRIYAKGYAHFREAMETLSRFSQAVQFISSNPAIIQDVKWRDVALDLGKLLQVDILKYLKTDVDKQKELAVMQEMQANDPAVQAEQVARELELQQRQANVQKTVSEAGKNEAAAAKQIADIESARMEEARNNAAIAAAMMEQAG